MCALGHKHSELHLHFYIVFFICNIYYFSVALNVTICYLYSLERAV